jgi:hypothetical protein
MFEPMIMLKGYLRDNLNSDRSEAIENCVVTHLCKHVRGLIAHGSSDIMERFHTYMLFSIAEKDRVAKALERQPDLKAWYDDFMQSIHAEIRVAFQSTQ